MTAATRTAANCRRSVEAENAPLKPVCWTDNERVQSLLRAALALENASDSLCGVHCYSERDSVEDIRSDIIDSLDFIRREWVEHARIEYPAATGDDAADGAAWEDYEDSERQAEEAAITVDKALRRAESGL